MTDSRARAILSRVRALDEIIQIKEEQREERKRYGLLDDETNKDAGKSIEEYLEAKEEAVNLLALLEDDRYIRVLKLKFLEYKKVFDIADIMGYSEEHIKTLTRNALRTLDRILTEAA